MIIHIVPDLQHKTEVFETLPSRLHYRQYTKPSLTMMHKHGLRGPGCARYVWFLRLIAPNVHNYILVSHLTHQCKTDAIV